MRIEPLGDSAFILREIDSSPAALAEHLRNAKVPGLLEANASYQTVGLYVDPLLFEIASLEVDFQVSEKETVHHTIPVCFELGEDLSSCADELSLSSKDLTDMFCSQAYRCFAVGFCPGFPYLGYLPPRLSGLERLSSPRAIVPAGSVAVARDQVGIYPMNHPGGWRILGRTPLTISNTEADYYPISAGHEIRFIPVSRDEFETRRGQRL